MKLINEVLKETTEQNYTLDIYISECKHDPIGIFLFL